VVRGPVVRKQLAQVAEGRGVVVVGERAQAEGVPGARGDEAPLFGVGGEGRRDQLAGMTGVSPVHGDHGGDEAARGGGDVGIMVVGCGQLHCVIPPARVQVRPAERGQCPAAGGPGGGLGAAAPGRFQQADRVGGLVERPRGGAGVAEVSPASRSRAQLPQVGSRLGAPPGDSQRPRARGERADLGNRGQHGQRIREGADAVRVAGLVGGGGGQACGVPGGAGIVSCTSPRQRDQDARGAGRAAVAGQRPAVHVLAS
jgi:hypothetical protein